MTKRFIFRTLITVIIIVIGLALTSNGYSAGNLVVFVGIASAFWTVIGLFK